MAEELLVLEDLRVTFGQAARGPVAAALLGRRPPPVLAVRGVNLSIARGETLGLVGESGCGKSTLGRAAVRLVRPSAGTVNFAGRDITALPERRLREVRRSLQMVFQDPYSSLDPSMTIVESVGEPLRVHTGLDSRDRAQRVLEVLRLVGLDARHLHRYPHEFSGGQRQRVALARAVVLDPDLVVCDEATSALDVSTQNQILTLLRRLQRDHGTAFLFISHNLTAVRHVAARVAVMYLGKVVEIGPTDRVFAAPAHPYTRTLLAAIPGEARRRRRGVRSETVTGELPSPAAPPRGCPFHTRCPLVMARCRQEMPEPTPVAGGGEVACHLQTDGPALAGRPLPADLVPADLAASPR